MTPEEFREHGHRTVDWIADYLATVESRPVLSQVAPGEIRANLPPSPPEQGEPFEAILRDVDDVVLPGVTHWQHPSFFAYFPANASGPAILGDLISSGLGVQGMLWATSPACTELEEHVLDWLAELLGLPPAFRSDGSGGGVIQDSASSATLVAVIAALHRATGGAVQQDGLTGRYGVYASSQAHSSLPKAVRMAGLGTAALRTVDMAPDTLALDPRHLRTLRSWRSPPSVRPPAAPSIQSGRSATSAESVGSGCTSTRHTQASPRSVPSCAG
jgi:aromatic-L-amino-acid decarboxylase